MTDLKWTEDLSVGDAGIDQQHRDLFMLIDRLESGAGDLAYAFEKLDEYVHLHFRDEESMLKAAGYPDLEAHQRLHKEFYDWLESAKQTIASSPENALGIGHNLQGFLKDWLISHIMQADQAYKGWLRDQKVG